MDATLLGLVGESPVFLRAITLISKVKDKDLPILLTGETGTGKELFARALHESSRRASQPFEAINCAAIPDTLLEAELFGVQKGAFSGADANRPGLFAIAQEGTVFLDEIGDLPLVLQVKLLRALQEREVRPVGSDRAQPIAARIVCATNRHLGTEINAGRFRQDLYFRINGFPIHLPALRERANDLPILVEHFLKAFNKRYDATVPAIGAAALRKLESYPFPGNVRELQNLIERVCILAEDGNEHPDEIILSDHAWQGEPNFHHSESCITYQEAKLSFEKSYLTRCLVVTKGNISEASRVTGMYRSEIYRMMNKHGLEQQRFKLQANDQQPGGF